MNRNVLIVVFILLSTFLNNVSSASPKEDIDPPNDGFFRLMDMRNPVYLEVGVRISYPSILGIIGRIYTRMISVDKIYIGPSFGCEIGLTGYFLEAGIGINDILKDLVDRHQPDFNEPTRRSFNFSIYQPYNSKEQPYLGIDYNNCVFIVDFTLGIYKQNISNKDLLRLGVGLSW